MLFVFLSLFTSAKTLFAFSITGIISLTKFNPALNWPFKSFKATFVESSPLTPLLLKSSLAFQALFLICCNYLQPDHSLLYHCLISR